VAFAVILQGCQGCSTQFKPAADSRMKNTSTRSRMVNFSMANPGLVSIYQDGEISSVRVYGLGLFGKERILHTAEFAQVGFEREDLITRKWVSWDVSVPEGAMLFGATSGVSAGFSHQFWVGWLVGRRLHMQALMQVKPIDTELTAEEVPIFPAITDHSGVGNLYTWRPADEGTALWRHSFTGQIKSVGTVTSEALSVIPGHPVLSVAGTIPGEHSQHAVIGWAEAGPDGAVLGIAIATPDRLRVIRSKPIDGMAPFARQRIALWAASSPGPLGRFQLSAVVKSQAEPPAYTRAVFDVGADLGHGSLTLSAVNLPPGTLHSAAFDYEKIQAKPACTPVYLTIDGCLWANDPIEVRRRGIDLDSPLPIVTTGLTHWGTRKADGTMTFEWF
jgi:hypothetical protein